MANLTTSLSSTTSLHSTTSLWTSRFIRLLPVLLGVTTLACGVPESERWNDGILLRPNGDVVAGGGELDLDEQVSGDVMVAGRSVTFDGTVGGSYLGVAGDQEIRGRVDGSVRAAGGYVRLEGSVGRNATLTGGSIDVEPATAIEGNAYLAGGSVRMLGEVAGDVYVGAGEVELEGRVGGDVRVEAGSLTVGPDARIEGELRYRISEDGMASVAPEAVVSGGIEVLEPSEPEEGGIGFTVFRFLAFLLAGAAVVAIFPDAVTGLADEIPERTAAAFGLGLAWLLLGPLAVLVVAATVVGIPLALMVAVLWGISLYLAPAVTGAWLGSEILSGRDPGRRWDAVLVFLTGGALVALAMLLPWVGWLARITASCFGLGAVVLALRDRRGGRSQEAVP